MSVFPAAKLAAVALVETIRFDAMRPGASH